MKVKYFPSLTGVRAVAAFLIVIHHVFENSFNNAYLNSVFREFNIGLSMFFVLSGFLIWHRYSGSFSTNRKWLRTYFINRIARIYPIYFLLTSITMAFIYFLHNTPLKDVLLTYLLNVTFLNGFSSTYVYSGIPQGWTLTVEELFYLSCPLLFFFNIKRRVNMFFLGVVIFLMGILLHIVFAKINFLGFFDDLKYVLLTTYFGRFFEFFVGIFLAKKLNSFPNYNDKTPIFTIAGCILILLTVFVWLPSLKPDDIKFSIQTPTGYLVNVFILPFFIAIFYLGLLKENSLVRKLLSTKLFEIFGKSSYSLYLIHNGIIAMVVFMLLPDMPIIHVCMVYLLSIFIWKYIEKPMHNRIKMLA